MTLAEIAESRRCRVTAAALQNLELQSRLYALGLYPGVEVVVLRFAPAGDPIQIRIGHTLLSIRKQEAAAISVEEVL
ncbi:MAG: ferrous iron transport protein A [Pseudomonadales bacterium]|nr:ferrous iron transport protein A [Pseudomonadales bacterium]